jgi:hypothetical protein
MMAMRFPQAASIFPCFQGSRKAEGVTHRGNWPGQSDQQFLTGDASGKQVTVAGQFRIAQGSGNSPSWC